jgi:hypothetical protein
MCTYRYVLKEHSGHLLVELPEGIGLVDTGSPVSIGPGEMLRFAGQDVALRDSLLGMTPVSLSRDVGTDFDFLLGMDALRDRDVDFDLRNGSLELGRDLGEAPVGEIPLEFIGGVPALAVRVASQDVMAVFDTGAPISYAARRLVEGLQPVEMAEDFHPCCGRFSTALYPVTWSVGAIDLPGYAGNLPVDFESGLSDLDVGAILGTAILYSHRARLSVTRSPLAFSPSSSIP